MRPFMLRVVALVCCWAGAALAQPAGLRGAVVADPNDAPVAGATVEIPTLGVASRTDSAGRFVLAMTVSGPLTVEVHAVGFTAVRVEIVFAAGQTLERDFVLTRSDWREPQRLPEVAVEARRTESTGRLAGFERRRRNGLGVFVTDSQIPRDNSQLAQVIQQRVPGFWVVRSTIGSSAWIAGGRGRASLSAMAPSRDDRRRGAPAVCYALVLLDGALTYGGRTQEALFDVNGIAIGTIDAIEFYRSGAEVPPELNVAGQMPCGLVAIWTK